LVSYASAMSARVGITIVAKDPADDAFIARLGAGAFAEYTRDPERSIVAMASRMHTLVAWAGKSRAGFAMVEMLPNGDAHLAAISVVEDLRGLGVGRKLLDAAESVARSWNARKLVLATAAANLGALDLFLRAGYESVERMRRYYARGQDALRLEKALFGTARNRGP
jgi:ribosomal protein S18 acetylase RimI-like enzyme